MVPAKIDFNKLSIQEIRNLIAEIESVVASGEQIDIPLKHYFSKDVYAREIFIPAGSLIVGKIHRHENLNILSQGEMQLISVQGCSRVKAPFTVVSPPGVKRVALAITDCIWTTIHGTNETDLEKIEEEFIVKSYDELLETKEGKCLG